MRVVFYVITSTFFMLINVVITQATVIPESEKTGKVNWEFLQDYSDEFNNGNLDTDKWDINVNDWGTWSWEPENTYIKDSALTIKMQQKEHQRGGKDYYFTSGIAQIEKTITYGYFEARVKASEAYPGTCPAFWLYSLGKDVPAAVNEGDIQYSEIDVVEIFQIVNELKTIEMNLHTRIMENGKLVWKRPGTGYKELCHNTWEAEWDPRDEFHTYGVLSRPDSIFWYIDGIKRAEKKNVYWHLPMHVTVSMGLRSPFSKYINGVRTAIPYPESDPQDGYPTEMYCDYVRIWEALPSMWLTKEDKKTYTTIEYEVTDTIKVKTYFDAGSGYEVINEQWNGMTCNLIEKDKDNKNVKTYNGITNKTIIGENAGVCVVQIPLNGATPVKELPEGNYYSIVPVFKSSKLKDGKTSNVFLNGSSKLNNIKIVNSNVTSTKKIIEKNRETIVLYPNPATTVITINTSLEGSKILVRPTGEELKRVNNGVNSISELSPGIYYVIIKDNGEIKAASPFYKIK